VALPPRAPSAVRLRLRLPEGRRIASVTIGGRPFTRFDGRTGTLDLSGLRGTIELVAEVGR
jgi:hypothetical protein